MKRTEELLFACALPIEERYAKRLGATQLVGVGCRHGIPSQPAVSFGFAGGLGELPLGTIISAYRVVDEEGVLLWQGLPFPIKGAMAGTILAGERIVDDPDERTWLREKTGADVVDMESGPLARCGVLLGAVRVVSDTPKFPLGVVATFVKPNGRLHPGRLANSLLAPQRNMPGIMRSIQATRVLRNVTIV